MDIIYTVKEFPRKKKTKRQNVNSKCSSEPVYITETEEETYQHKLSKAELYGKMKTFISFFNIWQPSPCTIFTSLGKSGSSKRQQGSLCKPVLWAERFACSRYRLKKGVNKSKCTM